MHLDPNLRVLMPEYLVVTGDGMGGIQAADRAKEKSLMTTVAEEAEAEAEAWQ